MVNHVTLHAQQPKETTLGDAELRSLTGQRRQRYVKARDIYEALVLDTLERGAREGSFELTDAKLTTYALIAQGSNVGAWFHGPGRLSLETVARIPLPGGPEDGGRGGGGPARSFASWTRHASCTRSSGRPA